MARSSQKDRDLSGRMAMRQAATSLKRLMAGVLLSSAFGLGACDLYLVDPSYQAQLQTQEPGEATPPPPPPEPLLGSESILFMDSITAQLEGCRSMSSLRYTHVGSFDNGMIVLRNSAIKVNANRMVPIRIMENLDDANGPHLFQVKLLRCPNIKDANIQGANTKDTNFTDLKFLNKGTSTNG